MVFILLVRRSAVSPMLRACVAEFVGTFGLLFAGTGAIMVNDLSGGQVTHLGIGLTFGLIVAAMIFASP